jgi:uncharacterized protein (TIGR02452 family)
MAFPSLFYRSVNLHASGCILSFGETTSSREKPMSIPRKSTAPLGREMKHILETGWYETPSGRKVEIGALLRRAREGTVSYPPDEQVPRAPAGNQVTQIEVVNETTLAAARRLVAAGRRACALNFASARNPGGGWLSGARAQEESLARSSGLVPCLLGNPMYEFHRRSRDPLYSSYALYSPDVPVLRDDAGTLLDEPYLCAFITAPAVNAGMARGKRPGRHPAITKAMAERVEKVLAIAAHHGHDALVLGAWGCGVFRNDPAEIAGLFRQELRGRYCETFAHVVFAVVDWSEERRIIGPFQRAFGG